MQYCFPECKPGYTRYVLEIRQILKCLRIMFRIFIRTSILSVFVLCAPGNIAEGRCVNAMHALTWLQFTISQTNANISNNPLLDTVMAREEYYCVCTTAQVHQLIGRLVPDDDEHMFLHYVIFRALCNIFLYVLQCFLCVHLSSYIFCNTYLSIVCVYVFCLPSCFMSATVPSMHAVVW